MTHPFPAPSDAPPPGPLAAETAQVLARVGKTVADTGDARHAGIFHALADLVTAPAERRALARVQFNDAVYAAMKVPLVDEATLDATINALLATSPFPDGPVSPIPTRKDTTAPVIRTHEAA